MKFAKTCSPAQEYCCLPVRVSRLCKKLKFLLEVDFGPLVVVNGLNTFDGLIVVLLNQVLGANFADVVETWVADAAYVLLEILS